LDWEEYRRLFEEEARREGRSSQFISQSLAYAESLAGRDLPIIFDFAHLAALLGFKSSALRAGIGNPQILYSTYYIPKRSSGSRRIDEPCESMKGVQRWVLRNILDKLSPHPAAKAFTAGQSIKNNAAPHAMQPMVLSLDIRDFFSSVRPSQVTQVFKNLGYNHEVAMTLTELTTYLGGLPQGAPTSPALSNEILRRADHRLSGYAKSINAKYSRYADDLTFSGRFKIGAVIGMCRRVLAEYGLELNEEKTRLMLRHERQEVTGVVVNERINAPRSTRRRLRQEIYYAKKYGIEEHERWVQTLYRNRRDHLRGLAEFVLFLNSEDRDARSVVDSLGRLDLQRVRKPPKE
jgi:RNA-directed DNA polymerase